MHLINFINNDGENGVIGKIAGVYREIIGAGGIIDLAKVAIINGITLEDEVNNHSLGDEFFVDELLANGRILPAVSQDPAHVYLTGTGLTHLGSAEGRDKMHRANSAAPETLTDSMRMFIMGVGNGKPKNGEFGIQPEWFYKGNGNNLIGANGDLNSPSFALDGGEEPEIAGIYVISDLGEVFRIGFALANEFSDHVVEKENYLWLAHSKLRPAAIGFELITGELPKSIVGKSVIRRNGNIVWEKGFLSGEDNMSHSIANLEYHHFKYDVFRAAGDVHVHFFGTATASFADGFKAQDDDIFEINADAFDFGIANKLKTIAAKEIRINKL